MVPRQRDVAVGGLDARRAVGVGAFLFGGVDLLTEGSIGISRVKVFVDVGECYDTRVAWFPGLGNSKKRSFSSFSCSALTCVPRTAETIALEL